MKLNNNDSNKNLTSKVTRSVAWVFSFQILDNLIGIVRLIILARLLSPLAFGLVGMALLTLQIINTFTQTGIHHALIHKSSIEKYLNTAWTYLLFRGFVIYGILYFITPYLGQFFNNMEVVPVIRTIGLTFLIESFVNIGAIYFQKNLDFDKQFIFQIVGNVIDAIVAITLAFILKDVWALVYGSIANNTVRIILSYILSSYRPKLEFNRAYFKELTSYGKWVTGSSILQFIYSQGDDILVGRVLGTTALGFYQLAYKVSNLPATQITGLISNVLFPAYAQIQSDRTRISKIYLSVLQLISYLSFPVGVMIIIFTHDFTTLFLGERWIPIVTVMQILTIWGIVRSIGATTGPVWQALGTPHKITKIQLIHVLILVLFIYPLTKQWGISGTALSVVIAATIPNILAVYFMNKTLKLGLGMIFKEIFYPLISSLIMAGVFYLLRNSVFQDINFIYFFTLAIISILTYLCATYLLYKLTNYTFYINLIKILETMLPKDNKILFNLKRFLNI